MSEILQYRLRVRTADDSADLFVATSDPDGINPYIESPPEGDGESLDPLTGQVSVGAYTIRVIDAVGTVFSPAGGAVASDGWEYANQAAAEAAGWVFSDTMPDGSITVGATDQVHGGSRSLKFATTGGGGFALDNTNFLRATKTFTSAHGITADTLYQVTVYARMSDRAWFDDQSILIANGVRDAVTTEATWQALSVTVRSSAAATLEVRLQRHHAFVSATLSAWWDDLTIVPLDVETEDIQSRVVTSVLADPAGRQQLLSKRAVIDQRAITDDAVGDWESLVTGYVTDLTLADALVWEFSVGSTQRIEQSQKVFDRIPDPAAHPEISSTHDGTAITGTLPTLDRASCLIGGPIVGTWGPQPDLGRPVFRVDDIAGTVVRLKWVEGYVSANFREREPPVRDDVRDFVNEAALEYLDSTAPVSLPGTSWRLAPLPGVVCRLYDVSTGDWVSDQLPMVLGPSNGLLQRLVGDWFFIGGSVEVYVAWEGTLPSEGDRYRVAVFPTKASERNPFHVTGHPVDIAASLYEYVGIAYDDTSRQTVKAALGETLTLDLRPTEPSILKDALENLLFGPFGFAARQNDDGEQEFFLTREVGATPVATVTVDDLRTDDGTLWQLKEQSAANRVVWESESYLMEDATGRLEASTPIDCVRAAKVEVRVTPMDAATEHEVYGDREIRYDLPGEIRGYYSGTAENPGPLDRFVATLASPLFDWYGRGKIPGEIALLRGVTDARIGQELTLDLPHYPSAVIGDTPVSQRGSGPRRAYILQRTEHPEGPVIQFEDRGPAASHELVPEFTLAADATLPHTVVEVTVTNENDLDGYTVRVEMLTAAVEPTSGQFVRTWIPDSGDNPFDLPGVCPGSVVWVRMRAESSEGEIGAWSPFQSLDLDDLTPASGLATVVDGTEVTLTWTNGETDLPVEVLARPTGDTTYTAVAVLPAGSTSHTWSLPSPEEAYTLAVRYRAGGPGDCVSSVATTTVTTGVLATLLPPINPAAWADGSGTFGMTVDGQAFPSGTEFWVAVETAVDSGVSGTYELAGEMGTTPARMRFQHPFIAPNDGLARFLMARHRRGDQVSAFTEPVSVWPWFIVDPVDPVPVPLPDPGVTVTPVPIVMLGAGMVRRFAVIGSAFTRIAVRDKFPLSQFAAMRIAVEVAEGTTVDDGVEVAARFRHPATGEWAYVDGEEDGGPVMALDQASLDAADAFGDADGQDDRMVTGEYVTISDQARNDVQLEVGLRGGDESAVKDVRLTRVELQVVAEEQATAPPPEMPEPPTQNPGECTTPTPIDMDTGWTGGDDTGAAWSDGGDQTYTLTLDGSGSGENAWEKLITGLEPDQLYTFYLTVTTDALAVAAFLEVVGGDTVEVETAGGETISVQGTASCDGEVTLRWGVQNLAGGGTGFFQDDLDYATTPDVVTGGWTVTETGDGVVLPTTTDTHGGFTHVLQCACRNGQASISRSITLTSGVTYTFKVWARTNFYATSNRFEVSPGAGVNPGFEDEDWTEYSFQHTASFTGAHTLRMGQYNGFFGLVNITVAFSDVRVLGGGGTAEVLFTDLGYCPGTGIGDGGTGLGDPDEDDPDGPANEEEPPEPPGGYPGPPVGGARPFGIFNIPVGGLGYWNSTHNALNPQNTVGALNESSTNDCMNMWKFGGERDWMSGGRFSYDRWKAAVDAVYNVTRTRAALEAAIAAENRPAWAHFVIDEPFHRRWGGTISLAVLDRMCTYSKTLFPTWPTIVRVSAIDDRLTRAIQNCDIYWAEYKLANGDCRSYRDANIAACEAMGTHTVLGIHYGAFDRASTGRYITPSEMRQYGGILASSTSDRVLALHGWRWTAAMHNQPGMQEAVRYVRDLFASKDP